MEGKFKKGDWITTDKQYVTQIASVEEDGYCTIYQGFIPFEDEKYWYLWSIQDAKDGDVLAFKNNIGDIIICKSPTNYDTGSYCRLVRLVSDKLINKEESGWDSALLVPATEEQRSLLFRKMNEAGYE